VGGFKGGERGKGKKWMPSTVSSLGLKEGDFESFRCSLYPSTRGEKEGEKERKRERTPVSFGWKKRKEG